MINKKTLSERDICSKFVTPALRMAGWNLDTQILEEVSFTDGKIFVRGKLTARGKRKRADYILYYNSNPIAIIEAKDNNHSVNAGIQQALDYAKILDIPCAFSTNGDGFLFHDRSKSDSSIETDLSLDQFPSPETLWSRFKVFKGIYSEEQERIISQEYYSDGSDRKPRYYQEIAINRSIEAIAKNQNRVLLVMATGTGKTYTAFQVVYRLWKASNQWTVLADFPGGHQNYPTCFSIGSKGYAFYGNVGDGSDPPASTEQLWEYDPQTNIWTNKIITAGNNLIAGEKYQVSVYNGKAYFISCQRRELGGLGYVYNTYSPCLEWDPATNIFKKIAFPYDHYVLKTIFKQANTFFYYSDATGYFETVPNMTYSFSIEQ